MKGRGDQRVSMEMGQPLSPALQGWTSSGGARIPKLSGMQLPIAHQQVSAEPRPFPSSSWGDLHCVPAWRPLTVDEGCQRVGTTASLPQWNPARCSSRGRPPKCCSARDGIWFLGLPELTAFPFRSSWPGRHLEVLTVQLPSILPGCHSTGPRHSGEQASLGMLTTCQAGSKEQTIPASLVVHLASCGAVWQSPLCSNLCGKLLRTQRTWKPWVPICRPGKRWAAEEPRLPVPVGWSWEAGKPSCRSLPGVSASLAGAGEPQTLPEPHSYFRKST